MPDKCLSHDQCIDKINGQIADMRDDLHTGFNDLKEMLHQGELLHTRFQMRFDAHSQAIKELEDELDRLKDRPSGVDWRSHLIRLLFGLLEKGILILCGAAAWAFLNGYLKQ